MSKFLHDCDDKDNARARAIPQVFSRNYQGQNREDIIGQAGKSWKQSFLPFPKCFQKAAFPRSD